jgi:hypothetical protein
MTNRQSILGLSILFVSMLAPLRASADVQACIGASEKGQRARTAGKLREARELFLVCGGEGCPAMVRRDCAQWQTEVLALTPGVVFGAKDKQGRDLFDVTVSMDGEPLLRKLDGKSVAVDPGPHTFKFEVPGSPPVIERALVKEGEKTRVVAVTFNDNGATASTRDGGPTPMDRDREKTPAVTSEGGHTVFPWIVMGVGAATFVTGAVIFFTSPSLPAGCSPATRKCTKEPTETSEAFVQRTQQAGTSESQPTLGLLVGGIGVVVLAGGLLWHFLEPSGKATMGSLRLAPWVGLGSGGATFGGAF